MRASASVLLMNVKTHFDLHSLSLHSNAGVKDTLPWMHLGNSPLNNSKFIMH